ncbi:hypothetical protein CRM22_003287 [Opisthorchis felineus]|uniref:Uncharacterized protein n=1 Tax=Opisthorchis felineus TaxID=147828 RepID=A0A4S2M6W7_OPIFE|nr:hypothetical protein CRM22_003287 [Opisthorchis felineus]
MPHQDSFNVESIDNTKLLRDFAHQSHCECEDGRVMNNVNFVLHPAAKPHCPQFFFRTASRLGADHFGVRPDATAKRCNTVNMHQDAPPVSPSQECDADRSPELNRAMWCLSNDYGQTGTFGQSDPSSPAGLLGAFGGSHTQPESEGEQPAVKVALDGIISPAKT